jgi:hypothetical protein
VSAPHLLCGGTADLGRIRPAKRAARTVQSVCQEERGGIVAGSEEAWYRVLCILVSVTRVYAYVVLLTRDSPAAAGLLTGKVSRENTNTSGSRWSSEHVAGQMYSASKSSPSM